MHISMPGHLETFQVACFFDKNPFTAAWGIDYFHLAKLDGKWMIMNVRWQSIPDQEG